MTSPTPTPPAQHGLGLIPTPPTVGDVLYVPSLKLVAKLPERTHNRAYAGPVRDQGQQNSCVGFAVTTAARVRYELQQFHNAFDGSPAFCYAISRMLANQLNLDNGTTITAGISALSNFGMTANSNMPYNPAVWDQAPPPFAYANALRHLSFGAYRVPQEVDTIKAALAAGHVVVCGVAIHTSFETDPCASTGMVPLPTRGDQFLGWHAQALLDYDDTVVAADGTQGVAITQNSWGNFGEAGYMKFPWAFLTNPEWCSDLWSLTGQH